MPKLIKIMICFFFVFLRYPMTFHQPADVTRGAKCEHRSLFMNNPKIAFVGGCLNLISKSLQRESESEQQSFLCPL